jgi:dipeptidyl aminopeptidase/acylaminoacyl peptidase
MKLTDRRLPSILLAAFVTVVLPAALHAQSGYFGQNKVQYRTFDFRVLKTDHFDVYYYPEEEPAAQMIGRMAERWYARLSQIFEHQLALRQPIILYASGPHFRQTNVLEGDIGEGTGGVTEAFKRRIVLPLAGPIQSTDHVLGHELVHAFQYDLTGTNVNANSPGALGLPLWFIEGMAEYFSIGPVDAHTAMWMRDAARREKLPDIDHLDNPKYFPYRYGEALWAYIGGKYGDHVIPDLLHAAGTGRNSDYRAAFKQVLGVDTKTLSTEWHAAEFDAYRAVAEVTRMPIDVAKPVILNQPNGGELNVSPELSPDGTKLMYFSERDLFSIDLYLADARTGKVIRKITNTATNAHFESLQFLESAGAWSHDGTRFVFPGISKGEPVLDIINVDGGKTEREIPLKGIDEVLNPTWSPDGNLIAFSGLVGGYNDLFVYDLKASSVRRLTTDSFAELDPAFSPDGKQIAFSTDRFSTKLDQFKPGDLMLAYVDVATGAVRQAGGFSGAKNISPQWSDDGRTIFFLSDRQGITNIYRMDVDGGSTRQITNLLSGASGITPLSPALSAAAGQLVFSAYENDGYSIYKLDTAEQLAGAEPVDLPRNAAVLPPRRTGEGPVYTLVTNYALGQPPATAAAEPPDVTPYKPKLTLDFAGQPTAGVGVGPFGTYAAGSMSFVFSDMLGNHLLATSVQATSRLDEFGGSVFYLNRTHRWNWGVEVDQTPYVAGSFSAAVTNVQGQNVYVEQELRLVQRYQTVSGIVTYPFSRALRLEGTGGFHRIGLKEDLTTRIFDLNSGQQISEDKQDIGSVPTANFGEASTALVYDTSIFGATSPIRGSRYRMEVSQSGGDLTYTGILADARTYVMPIRPYTLAFRGLYYGRYGRDSDDGRLPTLYLGYPGLVRGYDSGSFESFECGNHPDGSCPVFDRLIGSRVAIANVELRFPPWAAFGGSGFYGPVPVEVALFTDAGVAWGNNTRTFSDTIKDPVVSVGAAVRANVFGFAVAEINYVRPLDRPGRGWLWQFNLRPGF